ncbi:MAG: hypothetical protein LBF22_10535, partial [Deltaproteobacteria bacterium]|nr:hypothetical protein [Deltaproteobacteria bacterium]
MTNIFLKTILLGLFLSLCLEDLSLAEAFPKELKRLENIQGSTSVFMDSGVRDKAQREAAYFSSIQAGSLWRYQQIVENVLKPREKSLDALFD